ncbi:MAG: Type secretory pathway, VirD4 component [Herbinix sp.]|nr:Type secretory pathway, VirD4 component [Herbinix sp.]
MLYQEYQIGKCYGADFAKTEVIKRSLTRINLTSERYDKGGIPIITDGKEAYIDTEDNHTLVFGSTGSKKSRLFAMPLIKILMKAGESFIVTDPKGELYDRTAGTLKDQGYQCMVMNFRDLRKSDCWNPIRLASLFLQEGEEEKAYEALFDFVQGLSESVHNEKDPYWENAAMNILHGLLIIILENAPEDKQNIKYLLQMVEDIHEKDSMFKEDIEDLTTNLLVISKLRVLNNNSEKTVGSVLALVDAMMNVFLTQPKLTEVLSAESTNLRECASIMTAIYLILPDERTTYHFIASMFIKQYYEMLIIEAQKNKNKQLGIRMNFILDEFSNLPKISDMPAMITAARSRNIRFYLFIQSQHQLVAKYGGDAHTIKGNCNNWVFLNSRERELLEEIVALCGDCIFENNIRRTLISVSDLQQFSKEKGEALVLIGRNAPYITRVYDIEDYPWIS